MPNHRVVLGAALLFSGCGAFKLETPAGFDGEAVTVSGPSTALRIGDWQLSDLKRSTTSGNSVASATGNDVRRRQTYRFNAKKGASASVVNCRYIAGGRMFSLRGAPNYSDEEASLTCAVSGRGNWLLDVSNDPGSRLIGRYQGAMTYDVQGVAAPTGPVTGFYVEDAGETVAVIQIAGDRRVLFARALAPKQRDELMPAVAALLLLDEKVRQ